MGTTRLAYNCMTRGINCLIGAMFLDELLIQGRRKREQHRSVKNKTLVPAKCRDYGRKAQL